MRPYLGVAVLLLAANPARADDADGPGWERLFDGGAVTGLMLGPNHQIVGGELVVGETAWIALRRDVGAGFELRLVGRVEGKTLPHLNVWTKRFAGSSSAATSLGQATGDPARWYEYRIVGEQVEGSDSFRVTLYTRPLGDGPEAVEELMRVPSVRSCGVHISVPPGGQLVVRDVRLRVVSSPWPSLRLAAAALVFVVLALAVGLAVRRIRRGMREEAAPAPAGERG